MEPLFRSLDSQKKCNLVSGQPKNQNKKGLSGERKQ